MYKNKPKKRSVQDFVSALPVYCYANKLIAAHDHASY